MFQSRLDIANRACQLIGIPRIASFSEDSKQAQELAFSYETLRRAELRRDIWTFSTRKATIRPIGTGFMLIAPTLWSSVITYTFGSLVTDATGVTWQSQVNDNLNNQPTDSTQWELYCGPMTAMPYDITGTTEYNVGEVVYETPGDGTFTCYLSTMNANSQDPRVPSLWVSTTQYNVDQVVQYYALWVIGTTYAAGNTIAYNGLVYVSLAGGNLGNEPDTATTKWAALSATLAPAYYSATTNYVIGQSVTYSGNSYVCILASLANLPTNATYWVLVVAPAYYASSANFNLGNDPSLSPSLWSTTNPFGKANDAWLQLTVGLNDIVIQYPAGTGPSWQSYTLNVFMLPANFLRKAPQDPKAGSISILGSPGNVYYNDWNIEGNLLISREGNPITIRFIADVTGVSKFDDLFCECFAARLASDTALQLTQDKQAFAQLTAFYKDKRGEAITVNAIEVGAIELPIDDWIATRI